jgi:ketosteroid isomerase-like protein
MSKAEQEVRQVDNKRNEALVRGDMNVLGHIWADDLTLTNSRGEVHSKAQRIDDIQSGNLKFESYTNNDVLVRVYGDTAVMIGRSAAKYLEKGSNVSHQTRFTRVYVKRQERWQLVAQQTSLIAQHRAISTYF